MRVLCNEQRQMVTHCHCEGKNDDHEILKQCFSCHLWFHSDCWRQDIDSLKDNI